MIIKILSILLFNFLGLSFITLLGFSPDFLKEKYPSMEKVLEICSYIFFSISFIIILIIGSLLLWTEI